MSARKTCRGVRFSPHITETEMPKPPPLKPSSTVGNWRRVAGMCNLRPPVRFLQQASDRVTRAIRFIFVRRRVSPKSRSRPSVFPQQDSHRTEAIEDCIQFINSSCSFQFQRSNSVPINLSYY